jgi:hypothetical protein
LSVEDADLAATARPLDLAEPSPPLALPERPRDLSFPIDLARPRDLSIPEDLLSPPDLTLPPLPHFCDGIFVVDGRNNLLSFFDPRSLTFTDLTTLLCPTVATNAVSMAMARDGTAWIEFATNGVSPGYPGEIFPLDVTTGECRYFAYVPQQMGFWTFAMGFAPDAPGSASETLFVARSKFYASPPPYLGRIDLGQLTPIGPLPGYAALTGLEDGELWALFAEQKNAHAASIDKSSGAILEDVPLPQVGTAASGFSALGNFDGNFWLFIAAPAGDTKVYELHRPDNTVTLAVPNTNRRIVGAGVSLCPPGLDR